MKLRKPDRFDEIVKARMEKDGGIWSDSAADLLRNEHAWMRRMIKKQYKSGADIGSVNYGYNQAVEFFLEQLAQRRK